MRLFEARSSRREVRCAMLDVQTGKDNCEVRGAMLERETGTWDIESSLPNCALCIMHYEL